ARGSLASSGGGIPQDFGFFAAFDLPELLSATAWRTSALKADSLISSPSWRSIARRTFPSRLELKRRAGSFNDAPFANVSFTTLLYDSPVQMMPSCDQTGVPIHFHSSTTSGSASLMSLRILPRVSPRQSPSSAILFEMSSAAVLRRAASPFRRRTLSKPLDPGTKFELPSPRAAVLAVHVKVVPGDLVGQQHAVLAPLIRARIFRRLADPAVDDEMRDVDALRRQLARHALREAAQREFAHREGRRIRVALHARRGAGEENRARAAPQHAPCRRLADEKSSEGADRQRALDFLRLDPGNRPARAVARVVDDQVGHAPLLLHGCKSRVDLRRVGGIAAQSERRGLLRQRAELRDIARGKRDPHSLPREQPRERCAEAAAGTHDERALAQRCSICRDRALRHSSTGLNPGCLRASASAQAHSSRSESCMSIGTRRGCFTYQG